jgi:hypothetical protein
MTIAMVLPVTVHPAVYFVVPLLLSIFTSRAIANFHRRA